MMRRRREAPKYLSWKNVGARIPHMPAMTLLENQGCLSGIAMHRLLLFHYICEYRAKFF
jgi:hypothetical protein